MNLEKNVCFALLLNFVVILCWSLYETGFYLWHEVWGKALTMAFASAVFLVIIQCLVIILYRFREDESLRKRK